MPKCKVCGYRLGDGVTKCPMCGAAAGSTVAGEVSPDLNLPKYACPACKAQIIGEHRYCTNCGADLKKAAEKAQSAQNAQENKCIQCGVVLPAGAKFCNECGARQSGKAAQTVQQNVHTQKNTAATAQAQSVQSANVTSTAAASASATANVSTGGLKETPMEAFEYEETDGWKLLVKLKDTSLTEVVIPHWFTAIGPTAFSLNSNIETVIIPNTVKVLFEAAFAGCTKLENINIPDSVSIIEQGTFYGCTNLKSIIIPKSVYALKSQSFFGCESLQNITLQEGSLSMTGIYPQTFAHCKALKSITIPSSIGNPDRGVRDDFGGVISEESFLGSGLESIIIPNTVTHINDRAFAQCTNLKTATITASKIGKEAFDSCTNLENLTFSDSVTEIGNYAFFNCGITSLSIPKSVSSIGDNAFADCVYLTSLTIMNPKIPLEEIENAFYGCDNYYLKTITIGNKTMRVKHGFLGKIKIKEI